MYLDVRLLFLDLRERLTSLALRLAAGLLSAVLVAGFAIEGWRRMQEARACLRTSSSPGVGTYELLAGLMLGGLYRDIVGETLAAVAGREHPEVLEVGHGPGHLAERLLAGRGDLRWTGLDIDPAMVAAAGARLGRAGLAERARFVEGDVAAMPFDDASFDLVVSSLSAHHWPDAAAGFREIQRVLRPGGTALVFDLPAGWGHAETGSQGIAAAGASFADIRRGRLRGVGPVTIVWRVTLRRS